MADEQRRLFQVQGFANVEITNDADGYPQTISITMLNNEGYPILPREGEVPLVFQKGQFFNKQLFEANLNGHSVRFINVLLDVDEDQYKTLKQQTYSQAAWGERPQDRSQLALSSKDVPGRPRKDMPSSLDEWTA